MSGILSALVGPGGTSFTVTMAAFGASTYGYNDSTTPTGSISPTTYNGVSVKSVSNQTNPNPDQFGITLQGSRAQSFFTGVQVQKTDGTIAVLYTANASYADFTTLTSWIWLTDGIWTAATPSPRMVKIF